MCKETSSQFPVGTWRDCLSLSLLLLLSFRSPALWEALLGASGVSQPELHPWSKQAPGAAGSCFPVSAVLQTLSKEPCKLLFTLAAASRELRLGSYRCLGMSSMILSIPLAFALT